MRANGGYSTLGRLYREALKLRGVEWKTKTPFKSINRIVQDPRHFFRIRPGLWALIEAKNRLPADLAASPKPESDHAHYQGLLVEIGNLKGYRTFVPSQDRRRSFLGKPLGEIATVDEVFPFTYGDIIRQAGTIDVIWFNDRRFPAEFIEVENTTDMRNALLKFAMLDAFHSTFRVVSPAARKREFESRINHHAFAAIRGRTRFAGYELVVRMHTTVSEATTTNRAWTPA